jgi:hydroxymethylbilane synthase
MPGEGALRVGTRGSPLALTQAEQVAEALGGAEIVPIRTSGDEVSAAVDESPPAPPGGDKARFVREIERALLAGEVDLAVHSAKDVPTELPDGLEIAGVPAREDPRDAFVGAAGSIEEIEEGARIGTSSLRRRAQLLAARPDLEVVEIRGNVDTRLRKLADPDLDGVILAAAGLRRLGREDEMAFAFDADTLTPAAGQGFLAIETRAGETRAVAAAQVITDREALRRLACERAAVSALGASCDTPVGAIAWIESDRMLVSGFCGLPDGSEWIRDTAQGDASDPAAVGALLAERMLGAGATDLLARAEQQADALGLSK